MRLEIKETITGVEIECVDDDGRRVSIPCNREVAAEAIRAFWSETPNSEAGIRNWLTNIYRKLTDQQKAEKQSGDDQR